MNVLVYGSLNIDLIYAVDHIVQPGETISSDSLIKSAGGKGANQAAALAKAGLPTFMAGKIGQDGRFLLDLLNSYGVDTSGVLEYEGATGQAIIQLDRRRQNSIILFPGGNAAIQPEEIGRSLSRFGRGDLLVLQNEISRTGEIMEAAKKQGMRICLNPSPCNAGIEKLPLDLVDVFFVNEIEGFSLTGLSHNTPFAKVLDALVSRFPRSEIVLTLGKEGARYGCGSLRFEAAPVEVEVIDTTGAGDTFSGYFIAAQSRGLSVEESLRLACKAASIAVSRLGAMEAIPTAAEVFE
jgi:ribokinase